MEAPTFFSTGVVSAKVLLQVVSVATLTAISYFHFVHFLSCSTFMCSFGTHVTTQTQDIMTGVLVGNDAKETKIQKYKRWQRKNPRLLENQRDRERNARNRKLLPYRSLQNDTQKCYLKSQLLIKRSSSGIQHSYHEESCHLTK